MYLQVVARLHALHGGCGTRVRQRAVDGHRVLCTIVCLHQHLEVQASNLHVRPRGRVSCKRKGCSKRAGRSVFVHSAQHSPLATLYQHGSSQQSCCARWFYAEVTYHLRLVLHNFHRVRAEVRAQTILHLHQRDMTRTQTHTRACTLACALGRRYHRGACITPQT